MPDTDYYSLLGVDRSADAAAIKASYRKIAMECHPDRHGGCTDKEARFKQVSEAYEVLKDPQKRAAYDRFGHAAFANGGGAGFNGDFSDFMSDIFDNFFGDGRGGAQRGRGGGTPGRERGSDLR